MLRPVRGAPVRPARPDGARRFDGTGYHLGAAGSLSRTEERIAVREIVWMARRLWRDARSRARAGLRAIGGWSRFWRSYRRFGREAYGEWRPDPRHLWPCIGDDTATTEIEPVYFYQDAWAFERIVRTRPPFHVDVGSHHKYVALLSRVLPVTMVDIRPLSVALEGLDFRKGSILELPFASGSLPSVSSLCVIEHIGLGRYGDPIDARGHEKAAAELVRVVATGGDLYVSAPVREGNRTYFNAHRAFDEGHLLSLFAPLECVERRYVCGSELTSEKRAGDAVGCYRLRRRR